MPLSWHVQVMNRVYQYQPVFYDAVADRGFAGPNGGRQTSVGEDAKKYTFDGPLKVGHF